MNVAHVNVFAFVQVLAEALLEVVPELAAVDPAIIQVIEADSFSLVLVELSFEQSASLASGFGVLHATGPRPRQLQGLPIVNIAVVESDPSEASGLVFVELAFIFATAGGQDPESVLHVVDDFANVHLASFQTGQPANLRLLALLEETLECLLFSGEGDLAYTVQVIILKFAFIYVVVCHGLLAATALIVQPFTLETSAVRPEHDSVSASLI